MPGDWLESALRATARAVDRRAPRLARALRPPWRIVARWLGLGPRYWARRRHLRYYAEVVRVARAHVPAARTALDVGAADTELLRRLDWIPRRVALDRVRPARVPGVERVVADFLDYRPPTRFDLVLCLQVLEHVDDPERFARKLLATGRTVIISVPYRWPRGMVPSHVHDPVDEAMLAGWAGQAPVEQLVVANGQERLIAVFRASDAP